MKFEDIEHPQKVVYRNKVFWALPKAFWTQGAHFVWLSTNKRGNGGFSASCTEFEPAEPDAFVPPCDPSCSCCEEGSNFNKRK